MALEDKWFDFLDALEAKGIPVYSIVDPLEKRGIPSMPVALVGVAAVVCLIVFVVLPMLTGGGGGPIAGGKYTLTLTIKDNATGNPIQGVAITALDGKKYNGTTDKDGKWSAEVTGDKYAFTLTKENCDTVKLDRTIGKDVSINVSLKCAAAVAKPVTLCFDPRTGIGDVNVVTEGVVKQNCGFESCNFMARSDYRYRFETSNGYRSILTYGAAELVDASERTTCLHLEKGIDGNPPPATGFFGIMVKSEDGTPLKSAMVKLVNPNDSKFEIDAKATGPEGAMAGKAYFEKPVGTEFRILVPAAEGVSYFLSDESYEFSYDPQDVEIVLKAGLETQITVSGSENNALQPLEGVLVSVFAGDSLAGKQMTGTDGKAKFSLSGGSQFRATFFAEGYAYKEETITGGQPKSVVLEKADPETTGSISVHVMVKGTGATVSNAVLTLMSKGKPTGYDARTTDDSGNAMFTYVIPGDYCVVASRSRGAATNCGDGTVAVAANKTVSINISVEALTFALNVTVRKNGTAVTGAMVKVLDDFDYKEIASGTTINGTRNFEVPETKEIDVIVEYTDESGVKYKESWGPELMLGERSIDFDLKPLETSVVFEGAKLGTDDVDLSTAKLEVGKTYDFYFSLGIPSIDNQSWDTVDFEVMDGGNDLVELYAMNTPENGNIGEPLPGPREKLTLTNYSGDQWITLKVPVRIKYAFNGTKNYQLRYRAEWKQGTADVRDPRAQNYKDVPFTMTAGDCFRKQDLGVCLYVLDGDEKTSPSGFSVPIGTDVRLGIEIVNEGYSYSGKIKVGQFDTYPTTKFTDAESGIYAADGTKRLDLRRYDNFNFTEKDVIMDLASEPHWDLTQASYLQHGETVKAVIIANTVSPQYGWLKVYADGTNIGAFLFNITGDVEGVVGVSPDSLFDLTDKIVINVTEKPTGRPVTMGWITAATMSGSALSCGKTINLRSEPAAGPKVVLDANKGTFIVTFDVGCKLKKSGKLDIHIENGRTKPLDASFDVSACIDSLSTTPDARFKTGDTCQIGISHSQDGKSADFPLYCTGQKPASVNMRVDPKCDVKTGDALKVEAINAAIPSGFQLSADSDNHEKLTLSYSGDLSPAKSSDSGTVKVTVRFRKGKPGVASDYSFDVPVYVEYSELLGESYRPLLVQKYGVTLDCRSAYCNSEQAMKYLSGISDGFTPTASKNEFFKMAEQNELTSVDVAKIMSSAAAKSVRLVDIETEGLPDDVADGDVFLKPDNNAMPRVGTNMINMTVGEMNGKKYSFVTFKSSEDTALETAAGINLFMPVQTATSADKKKTNTEIVLGRGMTGQTDAVKALENALGDEFGTGYSQVSGASQKVVLEVCDASNLADFADDDYPCPRLKLQTATTTEPEGRTDVSAIYRDQLTNKIYFVGQDNLSVLGLINALNKTMQNRAVTTLMQKNLDDDRGGYLTTKPHIARVGCIKGDHQCDDETELLAFADQIKAVYAEKIGAAPSDIEIFPTDTDVNTVLVVCQKLEGCGGNYGSAYPGKGHLEAFSSLFGTDTDIPKGGIGWTNVTSDVDYFFAPDDATLQNVMKVKVGEKVAGVIEIIPRESNLPWPVVAGYREMSMLELYDDLASDTGAFRSGATTNGVATEVINITENPSGCYIDIEPNVTVKPGYGIGTIDTTKSVLYNNRTYLISVKKPSNYDLYGTMLRNASDYNLKPPLKCERTPPKVMKHDPNSTLINEAVIEPITLKVWTDEVAECRYADSSKGFGEMTAFEKTGATAVVDASNSNYLRHETTLSKDLTKEGLNNINVLCNDSNGNVMTTAYVANFTINSPPQVEFNVTPSSADAPMKAKFSVTVTDPTPGETLNYTIYFNYANNKSDKATGSLTPGSKTELGERTYDYICSDPTLYSCTFSAPMIQLEVKDSAGSLTTVIKDLSIGPRFAADALIFITTDKPGGKDYFRYLTLNASTMSFSSFTSVDGVGDDTTGAGVAAADVDGDGSVELVIAALDPNKGEVIDKTDDYGPDGYDEGTYTSEKWRVRYKLGTGCSLSGGQYTCGTFGDYTELTPMGNNMDDAAFALYKDNGKLMAVAASVDKPSGKDYIWFQVGEGCSKSGSKLACTWGSVISTKIPTGHATDGVGVAAGDYDKDGKAEFVFVTTDRPSGKDYVWYFSGDNCDANGCAAWSSLDTTSLPGSPGDRVDGAGITIADLNDDGKLEAVVVTVDKPQGPDHFRYMRGNDCSFASGAFKCTWTSTTWWPEISTSIGDAVDGAGATAIRTSGSYISPT
jgi:hypothetical protein